METGEVIDSYGPQPRGWITYGPDDRMMVVVAHDNRQKPSYESLSNEQKARLFGSFFSYAGRYELQEGGIIHHIDTSWNESWTGTTMKRFIRLHDGQAIYTTEPFAFSADGRDSVVTLVWEKHQ